MKELIDLFSERLKRPLWRALLVSFTLSNWKILLTLLYPGYQFLKNNSINDTIIDLVNGYNCILYPLLGATIYLFGMPFVENLVDKFQTIRKVKQLTERSKIEKDSYIEKVKYFEVVDINEKQREELVSQRKKYNDLEISNYELLAQKNNIEHRLEIEAERNKNEYNITALIGIWEISIYDQKNNLVFNGTLERGESSSFLIKQREEVIYTIPISSSFINNTQKRAIHIFASFQNNISSHNNCEFVFLYDLSNNYSRMNGNLIFTGINQDKNVFETINYKLTMNKIV